MLLAELHLGVLLAAGDQDRERRLATLAVVESGFGTVPVDDEVASRLARIAADARRKRRSVNVVDTLIGATAEVLEFPVHMQDAESPADLHTLTRVGARW